MLIADWGHVLPHSQMNDAQKWAQASAVLEGQNKPYFRVGGADVVQAEPGRVLCFAYGAALLPARRERVGVTPTQVIPGRVTNFKMTFQHAGGAWEMSLSGRPILVHFRDSRAALKALACPLCILYEDRAAPTHFQLLHNRSMNAYAPARICRHPMPPLNAERAVLPATRDSSCTMVLTTLRDTLNARLQGMAQLIIVPTIRRGPMCMAWCLKSLRTRWMHLLTRTADTLCKMSPSWRRRGTYISPRRSCHMLPGDRHARRGHPLSI
jgi:hypothetical protein